MAERATQIATSIEQSKQLLNAGLDPESADMWWTIVQPRKQDVDVKLVPDGQPYSVLNTYKEEHLGLASYEDIPAWSLSKLWDICNDSGIGPFNFGGDDLDSSSLMDKLIKWIILGIFDYEVLDEYLTAETIQELNPRADAKSGKNML